LSDQKKPEQVEYNINVALLFSLSNLVSFGGEGSSHVTYIHVLSYSPLLLQPNFSWNASTEVHSLLKTKSLQKMRRIWNLLSKSKQLAAFSSSASKFRVTAFRSYCDQSNRQNLPG